jgi:hypothetical protein
MCPRDRSAKPTLAGNYAWTKAGKLHVAEEIALADFDAVMP